MLKYWIALALVLSCALVIARHDEYAAHYGATVPTQPDKSAVATQSDKDHPQEHIENTYWNSPSGRIFRQAFGWPNGTGLWAIILTLLAIAEQGKESAKATRAMRDSLPHQEKAANAALLNAQAVIHNQRPWVTFFAMSSSGIYSFRAGNMGKSPAKIIYYSHETLFAHPTRLPEEPAYGEERIPRIELLMPGRKMGDQDLEICTIEPGFLMFQDIERKKKIEERQIAIIVILKIVYEDIGNPDPKSNRHETRMCFDWTPGLDFKIGGPKRYNEHT